MDQVGIKKWEGMKWPILYMCKGKSEACASYQAIEKLPVLIIR